MGIFESSSNNNIISSSNKLDSNLNKVSSSDPDTMDKFNNVSTNKSGDDEFEQTELPDFSYEFPSKNIGKKLNGGRSRLRHESTEDTDTEGSESSSTLERTPPDGGWGWVVVVAAFMINLVSDGVTFSFGVYYVEFLKYFGQSKSATAWIGSLLAAMPLLSGPIASSLTAKYGCRKVTIAGSLLSSAGFLLSSFSNSVGMLYLTFGVITGFGLSLCYVAAVVIVAYYFEQRRSLATGISVCGGGIGTFIFAPLTQRLIDDYGWRVTTRVLAAMFLQSCICGLLMRDLEWTKKSKYSHKLISPSFESLETRELSSGMKSARLFSSAVCIPTFVREQERLSSSSSNPKRVFFQTTRPLKNTSNNSPHSVSTLDQNIKEMPKLIVDPLTRPFSINLQNSSSSGTGTTISQHPLPPQQTHSGINTSNTANNIFEQQQNLHRHSLTYRGAVLSLKKYRLRPASSCPDIISVATDADERSSYELKVIVANVCKWFRAICEWKNLSSKRFVLFIISNFLLYMWYDVLYCYLHDAALKQGYDDDKSSYLISIVGLFNMIGNLTLGYMGDKEWTDSTLVYGICMLICGFSSLILPFLMSWSYVPLALDCGLYGLTIAANYSLTSVILVNVVSLERFANAYGLLLLVQGIGNLLGPPIAGAIYDWTGTTYWSFILSGVGIILSSLFILIPKIFNKCSNSFPPQMDIIHENNEHDDEDV